MLESETINIRNIVCLIGKIVIFKSKTKYDLCLIKFKNKLYQQYVVEKIIATNKDKNSVHDQKWKWLIWDGG